jgi:hypothetical protein
MDSDYQIPFSITLLLNQSVEERASSVPDAGPLSVMQGVLCGRLVRQLKLAEDSR